MLKWTCLTVVGDGKVSLNYLSSHLRDRERARERERKNERDRTGVVRRCGGGGGEGGGGGFQLGTFSHYQDESENRKAVSNKQDERKTTTVLLPVLEQGRKQQIF